MSGQVIYEGEGRILKGELRVNVEQMRAAVLRRRDCRITLTIEKFHATRSLPQNDYYWAVVVRRVRAAFRKREVPAGTQHPKVTHEILKAQFMDPELVRTGRIAGFISDSGLLIGTHTPQLNKLQFIEYLERIVDHAATAWDCYIPPPDPLWRQHAEQEGD